MSKSKCGSCTGVTGYTYTCDCGGTSASVDLSTLIYLPKTPLHVICVSDL